MSKRILLIQLRQLGDILLTTPALRAIRQAEPNAQIDFLSHQMGRLILADNPDIDEHLVYTDADSFRQHAALIKRLRSASYDLVFDFMYNPRSALLAWMTRAKSRIAFDSRRNLAYTTIVPKLAKSDYIVREKFALLRAVGMQAKDERLILPWSPSDAQVVQKLAISEPSFQSAKLRVVLSPTHRRQERRWPLQRYAALADFLVNSFGACVVWLWGPGEEAVIDQCQSLCQSSTLKAPPTSFKEMAALLANVDLFIGNSNGPSHVAVSTQIHSLQLHGPTLALTWCPNSDSHQSIQAASMDALSLTEVTDRLETMRASLEKFHAARSQKGVRMSWEYP